MGSSGGGIRPEEEASDDAAAAAPGVLGVLGALFMRPPAGAWFDSTAASVGGGGATGIDAVVALTRAGRDRSASVTGANVTGVSVPALRFMTPAKHCDCDCDGIEGDACVGVAEEDDAGAGDDAGGAPLASGGVSARLLLTITDGLAPWWPLDVHAKFVCCRSKKPISIQETKPTTAKSTTFNNPTALDSISLFRHRGP